MTNDKLASLARGVDKCVSCGLCVPLCPTWQVERNEANSPRGRLLIMAQLVQGNEPSDAKHYLDACLGCGRCEEVCPNDVPYMDLLPQAKSIVSPSPSILSRAIAFLSTKNYGKTVLGTSLFLLRGSHAIGLSLAMPKRLRNLARTVPVTAKRLKVPVNKNGEEDKVYVFAGCFGEILDHDALQAAINLLARTGHLVSVPSSHLCCGAIAHHAGDLDTSEKCVDKIRETISPSAKIATAATGCAMQLEANFGDQVAEAGELIAKRADRLEFNSAQGQTVMLHSPCTQGCLANKGHWCKQLLSHIPGLRIIEAPANDTCCGAGGVTHLTHRQTGQMLAERKLSAWQKSLGPDVTVLTTNHGCKWHLASSAKGNGPAISHPLSFVWKYLKQDAINT